MCLHATNGSTIKPGLPPPELTRTYPYVTVPLHCRFCWTPGICKFPYVKKFKRLSVGVTIVSSEVLKLIGTWLPLRLVDFAGNFAHKCAAAMSSRRHTTVGLQQCWHLDCHSSVTDCGSGSPWAWQNLASWLGKAVNPAKSRKTQGIWEKKYSYHVSWD